MFKRILAVILAASMLLCGIAAAADEDEAEQSVMQYRPVEEDTEQPEETDESADTVEATAPEETPTDIHATLPPAKFARCSDWALVELIQAQQADMLPTQFNNVDMRQSITRAEFAAVAVKLWQSWTGQNPPAAPTDVLSDTNDIWVLRAYALGIVNGFEDGAFRPNDIISRQDAATMLTRAYKASHWTGWTLASDGEYVAQALDYADVPLYGDHPAIYGYAVPAVYFMTKHMAISGVGNDLFAPRETCTREQAVLMAYRLIKHIG